MKYQVLITPDTVHKPVVVSAAFGEREKKQILATLARGIRSGNSISIETEDGSIAFFSAERLAHCDVRIIPVSED